MHSCPRTAKRCSLTLVALGVLRRSLARHGRCRLRIDSSTTQRKVSGSPPGAVHPLGCFTEPVYLSKPLEAFALDRTYIKATLDPKSDVGADALWRAADHAKSSPAWRYAQIETTHMIASNRPDELASILLEGLGEEVGGPDPATLTRPYQ